jgi:hypothetical protein
MFKSGVYIWPPQHLVGKHPQLNHCRFVQAAFQSGLLHSKRLLSSHFYDLTSTSYHSNIVIPSQLFYWCIMEIQGAE